MDAKIKGKECASMELKDRPKRILDGKTWLRYPISVWDDIEKSPEEKALHHPAMYPSALWERLLDCYLWHQGIVLDPFLGSGSTLVAALKKGHSGVGFEVVPEFCLLTVVRLKTVQPPNLFSDRLQPIVQLVKEQEPLTFERGQKNSLLCKTMREILDIICGLKRLTSLSHHPLIRSFIAVPELPIIRSPVPSQICPTI